MGHIPGKIKGTYVKPKKKRLLLQQKMLRRFEHGKGNHSGHDSSTSKTNRYRKCRNQKNPGH